MKHSPNNSDTETTKRAHEKSKIRTIGHYEEAGEQAGEQSGEPDL